jgi:RNA polymerase sigma-54 factor
MKQTLQLKVSQQLTLTPQLQQSIKLLQMSTLDLSSELERYLLENPLLERSDGSDSPPAESDAPATQESSNDTAEDRQQDSMELTDWGSGSSGGSSDGDDEFDPILNAPCRPTLREHLTAQMRETQLGQRDSALLALLISTSGSRTEDSHSRIAAAAD